LYILFIDYHLALNYDENGRGGLTFVPPFCRRVSRFHLKITPAVWHEALSGAENKGTIKFHPFPDGEFERKSR